MTKEYKIAGRTMGEWKALARQDDCFDHLVPSDLRELLQYAEEITSIAKVQHEIIQTIKDRA